MEFTRFDFDNKIFAIPGAYIFGQGTEREPMLSVQMGDLNASVPLAGICEEFGIDAESSDRQLLRLATKALDFVKFIAPGDQIPNEILDGTSSWKLEDRHLEYSKNRTLLSLASWASDQEFKVRDPQQISRILENSEIKKNLQAGFEAAAEELQLAGKDEVMPLIEQIARERSYVVSLKEYYDWILALPNALKQAQSILKRDKQTVEVTIRVHQLASTAVDKYRKRFDAFDAHMDGSRSILTSIPGTIEFIRKTRDDLHKDTLLWKEIEAEWKTPPFESVKLMRKNVNDLYSFLARNFMLE